MKSIKSIVVLLLHLLLSRILIAIKNVKTKYSQSPQSNKWAGESQGKTKLGLSSNSGQIYFADCFLLIPVWLDKLERTRSHLSWSRMDADPDVEMDSDGEELVTAGEVLQRLQKAWVNEKIAPELLFPLTEEVECMMEQLKNVEENLTRCQPKEHIVKHHKMEVERIRFLLASYLRTRLAKIQKYCWFIWDEETKRTPTTRSRLMAEERKFLKEYLQVLDGHLTAVGLSNMPPVSQKLPQAELNKIAPNLDSFVFFRVNRPAEVVVDNPDGSDDTIALNPGSQYIMKYRPLGPLITEDAVQLV